MMSVLLVGKDFDFIEALRLLLEKNGYPVAVSTSGEKGIEILRSRIYDLAVIEQDLPGMKGLETLEEIKSHFRGTEVLLISSRGDIDTAVSAMKKGARDFYTKPLDFENFLAGIKQIQREIESRLIRESGWRNAREVFTFDRLSSKNLRAQKVIDEAKSFSSTDVNILITGESGTGKGLLAKTIHYSSNRGKKLFIELNCSAIPGTLLESELFGYERGAFTDARETRQGMIEIAHESTLFLDEISTMDFNMQSKLLKVLEDFKFYRVGGRKEISVNVRLISATNSDLIKLVQEKKFREDLYYRLNVAALHLPSLRERKEDIMGIFMGFIDEFNIAFRRNVTKVSSGVEELLKAYDWSGNIRELRNLCERVMVTSQGSTMEKHHLPLELQTGGKKYFETAEHMKTLKDVEKEHIMSTLEFFKGNKSKAAEALGISRTTLIAKVKEYIGNGSS